jgi:hypothetical protein
MSFMSRASQNSSKHPIDKVRQSKNIMPQPIQILNSGLPILYDSEENDDEYFNSPFGDLASLSFPASSSEPAAPFSSPLSWQSNSSVSSSFTSNEIAVLSSKKKSVTFKPTATVYEVERYLLSEAEENEQQKQILKCGSGRLKELQNSVKRVFSLY